MTWKWAADAQDQRAFSRLPELLSSDPQTQDLIRRFLQSVAFKGDLQYLKLTDVVEKTFAGKKPWSLVTLNDDKELTLTNQEDLQFDGLNLSFLDLIDTPKSYEGETAKVVSVRTTEDGLEFTVGGGNSNLKGGKASASGTTAIGGWTSPDLDTSEFDSGSVVELSDDRLRIPEDGYYLLVFRYTINDITAV